MRDRLRLAPARDVHSDTKAQSRCGACSSKFEVEKVTSDVCLFLSLAWQITWKGELPVFCSGSECLTEMPPEAWKDQARPRMGILPLDS